MAEMETLDLAGLREVALAAAEAWGDNWLAEDVGYSEMRGLTYEVKDVGGAWVASAGCEELANHMAAFDPATILALLAALSAHLTAPARAGDTSGEEAGRG